MKQKLILVLVLLAAISFRKDKNTSYKFPELKFFPPMPVAENNPATVAGVELGRYLFYDPILSIDSTISCASCHKQEAAFSDAPNTFSRGISNVLQHRNTLPLFNLAWYPQLFWDGRAGSIEDQVFHPVRTNSEMNMQWADVTERLKRSRFYRQKFKAAFGEKEIDSTLIAFAIAQFERTLLSYRSKYDSVLAGKVFFTEEEIAGYDLMNDMTKGDCLHCHTIDSDPLGTTLGFSNNGLDETSQAIDYKDPGRGKITSKLNEYGSFKIPSLRNVAVTPPYMHDGRFKTLEEVLDFYSEGVQPGINTDSKMEYAHQNGVHLSKIEKQHIVSFLKTLTDSAFLKDPMFSNPFQEKRPSHK